MSFVWFLHSLSGQPREQDRTFVLPPSCPSEPEINMAACDTQRSAQFFHCLSLRSLVMLEKTDIFGYHIKDTEEPEYL